ncbi:hypothetical protein [Methanosarcina mazei]|uniref:Uncharacterized protein n=2 Tax=Methanosarcina mazei TaxID=2209 RepID=A0A0F8GJY9_METMZ|nr:hypothetical protein [Methanosarcina mazei]AAM31721.1 hypothetical protein MM_2025 [Methanosarcina mazei Go1]KKG65537.1 hypothetical protein DU67_16680 [Methanosarcina mazei]KKG79009.1 hypothetical protein DU55_18045 [Methanosarcina mazei]WIM42005.1 hypothetical protein PSF70_10685 [Methanosarcina mazei]WIM45455.1 hypothetical protein PQQ20_10610 [Methanosarcina mazei]
MTDIMDTLITGLVNYFVILFLILAFYGLTLYIIKELYDSAKYTSITDSIFEWREYGTKHFILNGKTPLIILDLILYISLIYLLRDAYLLVFQKLYPIDLLHFTIYATLGLILLPIATAIFMFFSIIANPNS